MPRFDPMKRDSLKNCPFDKHRGKPWNLVVSTDRKYVEWLVSGEGPALDPDLEETLINLLEMEDELEDTVEKMYGEYRNNNLKSLRDLFDDYE